MLLHLRIDYVTKHTGMGRRTVNLRTPYYTSEARKDVPFKKGTALKLTTALALIIPHMRQVARRIPDTHTTENAAEVRRRLDDATNILRAGSLHSAIGVDKKRWQERMTLTLRTGRNSKSYFFSPEELQQLRSFMLMLAEEYDTWRVVDD